MFGKNRLGLAKWLKVTTKIKMMPACQPKNPKYAHVPQST